MIVDCLLAPARWVADRVWFVLAARVLPAIDDNLVDIDDAEPIPYVLVGDGHGCDR